MMSINEKLQDTLNVFYDLNNLYYYEENNGKLKIMYDNMLEVLSNSKYDVSSLKDENNNNLLHLAAQSSNVKYFLLAAKKGLNPYDVNLKKLNAFHGKDYDFANQIWKKFEHLYFDNKIPNKSFEFITEGYHVDFKQSIFEKNIRNNSTHYSIDEISNFLKQNNIYSHDNVLLFCENKIEMNLTHLFDFVNSNEDSLLPKHYSMILFISLKNMSIHKKQRAIGEFLLPDFLTNHSFDVDSYFLRSINFSAQKYNKDLFKEIFHEQIKILFKEKHDFNKDFDFYFDFFDNQKPSSFKTLMDLLIHYDLTPVYHYISINEKFLDAHSNPIKKHKI